MTAEDDEVIGLADASQDQYFLSSPEKLALLVDSAGILLTDHVVEVGAGIGTVARSLPSCASLTLIELDERFIDILRARVPHATVIQGDALSIIQKIPCDVLLSNLPNSVTPDLLAIFPRLNVRTAVVAVGQRTRIEDLNLGQEFTLDHVTSIGGDDFRPPQPVQSELVRITRA